MTRPRSAASRRAWARAALVVGPLAALLGLSELSLRRLGENLYRYPFGGADPARASAAVWCIGDSWTQGAGAPPGQGYPERLAESLRAPVYNLGAGGTNTSQHLSILRQALERGKPRVVVYLGGANDRWSLVSVDPKLIRERLGFVALVESRLQNLRTYKFLFNYAIPAMARRLKDRDGAFSSLFLQPTDIGMLIKCGRYDEAQRVLSTRRSLGAEERLLQAALDYDLGA